METTLAPVPVVPVLAEPAPSVPITQAALLLVDFQDSFKATPRPRRLATVAGL